MSLTEQTAAAPAGMEIIDAAPVSVTTSMSKTAYARRTQAAKLLNLPTEDVMSMSDKAIAKALLARSKQHSLKKESQRAFACVDLARPFAAYNGANLELEIAQRWQLLRAATMPRFKLA